MKENHIVIKADRLNFPLEQQAVGRLSSAVFVVEGDIPDDTAAISVKIEYVETPATQSTSAVISLYTANGTLQEDGTWRVYLAPAYFPARDDLSYHVMSEDGEGNPRWLGTGRLVILDNPSDGSPVMPDILPRNTYAYNPETGLYYKLVAEVNELGEVQVAVDQEGVEL